MTKEKPDIVFTRDFFVKKGREGGKKNTVEFLKEIGKKGLKAQGRKLKVKSKE